MKFKIQILLACFLFNSCSNTHIVSSKTLKSIKSGDKVTLKIQGEEPFQVTVDTIKNDSIFEEKGRYKKFNKTVFLKSRNILFKETGDSIEVIKADSIFEDKKGYKLDETIIYITNPNSKLIGTGLILGGVAVGLTGLSIAISNSKEGCDTSIFMYCDPAEPTNPTKSGQIIGVVLLGSGVITVIVGIINLFK